MPWIKRNLFFVVGGLGALVLMGFAGFFLFANIKKDKTVSEELERQISELNRLYAMDPHPGTEDVDNITAAKKEQQRIRAFLNDAHKLFVPVVPYEKTNNKGFNNLLLSTIYELQTSATNAGVVLPPQFAFTFSAQKGMLTFTPGSIEPWTAQLSEIKAICSILYEARINALEGLRRVPVSPDDPIGTADYLTTTIVTNDIAVVSPYEVTFRSFSGELGAVMDGILRSTNCFIVKTLNVVQSQVPIPGLNPNISAPGFNPVYPPPAAAVPSARDLVDRYNPVGAPFPRPVAPTPAPVPGRPPPVAGSTVFLSEKPLRVTLLIDVVKLKPQQ
ncbi:MAG: hypothetical protein ABIR24_06080 [Verrucomicrobiota bacterium]